MKPQALSRILALGAITGMRSMAGPAALALARGGVLQAVVPSLAAGEMFADKTAVIGNRTDPLPLAGRAVMGAIVGGTIAQEEGDDLIAGSLIGAATAIAAAHVAFQVRRRLAGSSALGGVIEDALVLAIASRFAARSSERLW